MQKIKLGNVYYTYAVMLKGDNRVYVGMTENFIRRFNEHLENCIKAASGGDDTYWANQKFYGQFARRGLRVEDVTFYVIEMGLTYGEACEKEGMLIDKYRSYNPRFGWNNNKRPKPVLIMENIKSGEPPIEFSDNGSPPISARPERGGEP